jgi:hypothetical protein
VLHLPPGGGYAGSHPAAVCARSTGMVHMCAATENWHPGSNDNELDPGWWTTQQARFSGKARKLFDRLVCTVTRTLWKNDIPQV